MWHNLALLDTIQDEKEKSIWMVYSGSRERDVPLHSNILLLLGLITVCHSKPSFLVLSLRNLFHSQEVLFIYLFLTEYWFYHEREWIYFIAIFTEIYVLTKQNA